MIVYLCLRLFRGRMLRVNFQIKILIFFLALGIPIYISRLVDNLSHEGAVFLALLAR